MKAAKYEFYRGRCENPECRNITEYAGISRNITTFFRNIPEPNITIFSDGGHATVYKHGRLTTYFITKVMDISHFDGK
jgi:hypothetical protein